MDYLSDASDLRLKPRLLRSLTRDRLPVGDGDPLPDLSQLLAAISVLKSHALLSESSPSSDSQPLPTKIADAWRTAVDAWVTRVLTLATSKMPDKLWVGTGLVGVTCEECSDDRFLKSFSDWFYKLLSNFQPLPDSHFVRVALCASLLDLFTRLAAFPSVKKEATTLAVQVAQPLLQLLSLDLSDAVWMWAVDFLCVLVNFFPSSIYRHNDKIEAVIVSKIMSGKYSQAVSKKLSRCLSLLPKVKGDEASWSIMFKKVLISINTLLSDAFEGLEEGSISSDMIKLLIPPGDNAFPPLGGYIAMEESSKHATKWLQSFLAPRVSTLMQCCALMVTNVYPVQVTIPIQVLLKLARRVLSVDGSLYDSLLTITSRHQEDLCSVLPALHMECLDLLYAIIKGMRSQLLPHAANVARILTDCFGKSSMPSVRIKLYQLAKQLLNSFGAGMAFYLSQEIIKNTFADLSSFSYGISPLSGNDRKVESELTYHNTSRKRKHNKETSTKSQSTSCFEVKVCHGKQNVPISIQIAALGALEALVTVGGSLKSGFWRSDADLLLIKVATISCDVSWKDSIASLIDEPTITLIDFRLAVLQTLLASLLSPARVRPPYLSQGLKIFCKGKQEANPKIAALCSHALLALETLIHPRALPLAHPSDYNSSYDAGARNHPKDIRPPNFPFPTTNPPVADEIYMDQDDDLYRNCQDDGEKQEATVANQENPAQATEEVKRPEGSPEDPTGNPNHPQVEPAVNMRLETIHEMGVTTCDQTIDTEMASENLNENVGPGIDEPMLQDNSASIPVISDATIRRCEVSTVPAASFDAPKKTVFPDAPVNYDSDDSLGSIPPIVNIEPDSDSS